MISVQTKDKNDICPIQIKDKDKDDICPIQIKDKDKDVQFRWILTRTAALMKHPTFFPNMTDINR